MPDWVDLGSANNLSFEELRAIIDQVSLNGEHFIKTLREKGCLKGSWNC